MVMMGYDILIFCYSACSYVLAFQDQTISQSEIFYVIVECSYVLAFQDQTPSQSEILSVHIYFAPSTLPK